MRKCVVLGLLVLILSLYMVSSLGITPGRTTLRYEPGVSQTVRFSVINSEGDDAQFIVLVQGELNQSIAFSDVSFTLSAQEPEKVLEYVFTAPRDLSPGTHASEIVVVKIPKKEASGATFVGAAVGVTTQLRVVVPYPGKYAEADLQVAGPAEDGGVTFILPVVSRGDLDLAHVRAHLDIYTSLNEKVHTLSTSDIPLTSGSRGELVATWNAQGVPSGSYRVVATVLYDEQTLRVEKTFELGTRLLELQGVEVRDFSLGEIAKFELLVENKWSQPVSGVYADMMVYNGEHNVIANFKSAPYDISALEKNLLVMFWDTEGVREGRYDASVFLNYGAYSNRQDFALDVSSHEISVIGLGYVISSSDSESGSSLTIVLISLVGVLILINLLWFLFIRKRLKR